MKRVVFLLCLIGNIVMFANPVGKALEVEAFIKKYTTSTYNADTKVLRTIFHKDALLSGYLPNVNVSGSVEHFLKDLESRPSMKSQKINYLWSISYLNVQGKVASVTLEEKNFFGKGKFVNYLSLKKEDNTWKIVSKVFTFKE